jgi:hypothetical protein
MWLDATSPTTFACLARHGDDERGQARRGRSRADARIGDLLGLRRDQEAKNGIPRRGSLWVIVLQDAGPAARAARQTVHPGNYLRFACSSNSFAPRWPSTGESMIRLATRYVTLNVVSSLSPCNASMAVMASRIRHPLREIAFVERAESAKRGGQRDPPLRHCLTCIGQLLVKDPDAKKCALVQVAESLPGRAHRRTDRSRRAPRALTNARRARVPGDAARQASGGPRRSCNAGQIAESRKLRGWIW